MSNSSALRPVTLPNLPPAFAELSNLRSQLEQINNDIVAYSRLEKKLETITDEPRWDAMIPAGPLAYFPGQLVHTNDISFAPHSSSSTSQGASHSNSSSSKGKGTEASSQRNTVTTRVTKSAKQARESAKASREALESNLNALSAEIQEKEGELASTKTAGMEDGWGVNENGEILNEEGLPLFDIHEELPPEEVIAPTKPVPVPEVKSAPKAQMRYLIQKNGKQTVRPTKMLTTPATLPKPRQSLPKASEPISNEQRRSNQALLDQLEKEEEDESKATASAAAAESLIKVEFAPNAATPTSPVSKSANIQTGSPLASTPAPTTKLTLAKPKIAMPGLAAGFLARKSIPRTSTPPVTTSNPVAAKADAPSTISEPRLHEPLHHVLPPSKSIYRPTPPPSAPSTRPSSPRPDRKVVFEVPEKEASPAKTKRAAIILPPPPEASTSTASVELPPPPKTPFMRPLKETVFERAIQAPSVPTSRPKTQFSRKDGDGYPLRTLGRAPKPDNLPPSITISTPSIKNSPTSRVIPPSTSKPSPRVGVPIHTISLSNRSGTLEEGHASLSELIPEYPAYDEQDEERPKLGDDESEQDDGDDEDYDEDDSDSSGFYGNEDDEDDDEDGIDIDGALHAREVALDYHRLRMNVGAGAGTGPLGGELDPQAYDSWNQANVPMDATLQGRPAGSARSSRFRTGRLESAQMIIPSLLAQHVKQDNGLPSDDEDDGLTAEQRERVRATLEELSGKVESGGRSDMTGKKLEVPRALPSLSAGVRSLSISSNAPIGPASTKELNIDAGGLRQPGSTRIAVPSNPPLRREPIPEVSGAAPPKKMSRFKARQLGLEFEE